jgi:hypothetical protein
MKIGFFGLFSKYAKISNLMKIRLVEADLFDADRRTDITKLIVTYRNFAKAPK